MHTRRKHHSTLLKASRPQASGIQSVPSPNQQRLLNRPLQMTDKVNVRALRGNVGTILADHEPEKQVNHAHKQFSTVQMSNKKRIQQELKDQYLEQMKLNRVSKLRARQMDQQEQKLRIEEAHLSLDRERNEKQRQRYRYIDELNFFSGQKKAERQNEKAKQQMEMNNDLNNIEQYVQKELRNEQAYRDRLDVANFRMMKNSTNLVSQLEHQHVAQNYMNQRVRLDGVMDGLGNNSRKGVHNKSQDHFDNNLTVMTPRQRSNGTQSALALDSAASQPQMPGLSSIHDPYANDFLAQQIEKYQGRLNNGNSRNVPPGGNSRSQSLDAPSAYQGKLSVQGVETAQKAYQQPNGGVTNSKKGQSQLFPTLASPRPQQASQALQQSTMEAKRHSGGSIAGISVNIRPDEQMRFEPKVTGVDLPKRFGRQINNLAAMAPQVNQLRVTTSQLQPISLAYGPDPAQFSMNGKLSPLMASQVNPSKAEFVMKVNSRNNRSMVESTSMPSMPNIMYEDTKLSTIKIAPTGPNNKVLVQR